ncbi:hypothetical protein [Stappia stellulata]|uniref:hypothetical protein n=1 Tax=Stappia stellulata TaxID=71235 RepID=UPI0004019177|nr:hypothetical protein [Stappia stellulata]
MSALSIAPSRASADANASAVSGDPSSDAQRFAELRVLAAGCRMRWGGSPNASKPALPLSAHVRAERLEALLALWETGCRRALDEELFRDIAQRHPRMAATFRKRLCRRDRRSVSPPPSRTQLKTAG